MQIALWTMIVVAVGWVFKLFIRKDSSGVKKEIDKINKEYEKNINQLQNYKPIEKDNFKDILNELNRFKEHN